MTRDEERKRRIDSARELRGVLQDIGRMKNEDSRTGIIHDKMMAAMDDVCERHQNGGFSAEQIALLKELMFQRAFIIDPRHKPRSRLRRDLSEMSWPRRITWAIGII